MYAPISAESSVFFVYPVKSSTVAYEPESESMIDALPSSLFMYVSIDAVRSDFFAVSARASSVSLRKSSTFPRTLLIESVISGT